MRFGDWMDRKVKRMDWIDMGCIKAGAMLFGLLAAKLWPALLSLDPWVYVVVLLLVSIRPVTRAFLSPGSERE